MLAKVCADGGGGPRMMVVATTVRGIRDILKRYVVPTSHVAGSQTPVPSARPRQRGTTPSPTTTTLYHPLSACRAEGSRTTMIVRFAVRCTVPVLTRSSRRRGVHLWPRTSHEATAHAHDARACVCLRHAGQDVCFSTCTWKWSTHLLTSHPLSELGEPPASK